MEVTIPGNGEDEAIHVFSICADTTTLSPITKKHMSYSVHVWLHVSHLSF